MQSIIAATELTQQFFAANAHASLIIWGVVFILAGLLIIIEAHQKVKDSRRFKYLAMRVIGCVIALLGVTLMYVGIFTNV